MANMLFRLWVVLLVVSLQVGRSQMVAGGAWIAGGPAAPLAASGEADTSEEMSGGSLVDEVFEPGEYLSTAHGLLDQQPSGCGHRSGNSLSPGRPASGAPFKPPRARG